MGLEGIQDLPTRRPFPDPWSVGKGPKGGQILVGQLVKRAL